MVSKLLSCSTITSTDLFNCPLDVVAGKQAFGKGAYFLGKVGRCLNSDFAVPAT
jgi:hypothetical protein